MKNRWFGNRPDVEERVEPRIAEPGDPIKLTLLQDFVLGSATISPSSRSIRGPSGRAVIEPRMMQVLVAMAAAPGHLVTRLHLLDRCWGGAPVGDDSINAR